MKNTNLIWFILFSFFANLQLGFAEKANVFSYFNYTAKKGETVQSILKKFDILDANSGERYFLKLNKIPKSTKIVPQKKYQIPLFQVPWDGKSIRTSTGISDWKTALRVEKYNHFLLQKGLIATDFKKNKILYVPYFVKFNVNSDEKIKNKENRIFPIFGSQLEYVPLKNNSLKGKVFYIDAGHGGPDPGAMARFNGRLLCEDEYAYDVSLRLLRLLVERGAIAHMITRDPNDGIRNDKILICDRDELCWEEESISAEQKKRLFQRTDAINVLYEKYKKKGVKDQKLVVIHIDSRNVKKQTDVFFYHEPDDKVGSRIAQKLQSTFEKNYKRNRRGWYKGSVTARNLHLLRESKPTSVYVEIGNIQNAFDQKRILESTNRQALADWLLEGLTK